MVFAFEQMLGTGPSSKEWFAYFITFDIRFSTGRIRRFFYDSGSTFEISGNESFVGCMSSKIAKITAGEGMPMEVPGEGFLGAAGSRQPEIQLIDVFHHELFASRWASGGSIVMGFRCAHLSVRCYFPIQW